MLKVKLASVGNIDHGQNPYQPVFGVPNQTKEVSSLEEASKVCREYIAEHELGGGNWSGGFVFDGKEQIAYISYNGRIWEKDSPYFLTEKALSR